MLCGQMEVTDYLSTMYTTMDTHLLWETIHKRSGPFVPHTFQWRSKLPKMTSIQGRTIRYKHIIMHSVPVYVCGMFTRYIISLSGYVLFDPMTFPSVEDRSPFATDHRCHCKMHSRSVGNLRNH